MKIMLSFGILSFGLFILQLSSSDSHHVVIDQQLSNFLGMMEHYVFKANDIVFLLNESGTKWPSMFYQVKLFAKLMAQRLSVSLEHTRVSVVTFATNTITHLDYIQDSYRKNMCTLNKGIDDISYISGGTQTDKGLRKAEEILARGRPSSNKIIVLVTDGHSNDGHSPVAISHELKQKGIIIFAIGVIAVNEDEINAVATSPDHAYILPDFDYIVEVNTYLVNDLREVLMDPAQNKSDCNNLCLENNDCCDKDANCYCGSRTGRYECVCNAGYHGRGGHKGQCHKCPKGTFKSEFGNFICTTCPSHSSTSKEGSTSSADCICEPGYTRIGIMCEQCPKGTFKSEYGNSNCTLCPSHSSTAKEGSTSSADCICETGYVKNGKACEQCLKGSFKAEYGNSNCTTCPFHSSTAKEGSTSLADCICEPGYTRIGIMCERCAKGTFKSEYGNSNCTPCPFHSSTAEEGSTSSADCICETGYVRTGIACEQCPKGTFKSENGDSNCTTCPFHSSTAKEGSTSLAECICEPGYARNGTTCVQTTCPFLHIPIHGTHNCTDKDFTSGTTCSFKCNNGFQLSGTENRKCLFNEWSGDDVTCTDNEPPKIVCPESITVTTDEHSAYALVQWERPVATDNVPMSVPRVRIIIAKHIKKSRFYEKYKPSYYFPIRTTNVMYEATDHSNLKSYCYFTVTVLDTETPQVIFCSEDIEKYHHTHEAISVEWTEPVFKDNSKNLKSLTSSHKSGDKFHWGPATTVFYEAVDESGNTANCSFEVKINQMLCPALPIPSKGMHNCSEKNVTFGTTCSFTCDEGHEQIGPTYRTCMPHGWTGDDVTCKDVLCPDLPIPINGRHNCSEKNVTSGTTCSFTCDEGHDLVGSKYRTCLSDRWTGDDVMCKETSCPALPFPNNGMHNCLEKNVTFGTTCNFTCNEGYELTGTKHRTCLSIGWTGEEVMCKVMLCRALPIPSNGRHNCSEKNLTSGTTCSFTCDEGHELIGPKYRTCLSNGWTGDDVTCKEMLCPALPIPSNGRHNCSEKYVTSGTTCSFTCDEGHELVGSKYRTCLYNKWTGDDVMCKEMSCSALPVPNNGMHNCLEKNVLFGTTCSFTCNEGYELTGTEHRTCLFIGWTGKEVTCNEMLCRAPPIPSNGSHNCSENYVTSGTTCSFTCDEGHELVGPKYRTCLSNKWTGDEVTCKKMSCPALLIPNNGMHNCSNKNVTYGTTCSFTCNEGYELIGPEYRTCLNNRWNSREVVCKAKTCPALKSPTNGVVNCLEISVIFGTICHFRCKIGYHLKGSEYRQCVSNGWTGNDVTCTDIEPPKILCPNSITVKAESYKSGAFVDWKLPEVEDNVPNCVPSLRKLNRNILLKSSSYTHYKHSFYFPIGATKVVYEAADCSNLSTTCSFMVTVQDKEAPQVLFCPGDIELYHHTNEPISVNWTEPVFVDNSKTLKSVIASRRNGDRFTWGPAVTVFYEASDESGNTANCSFRVKIKHHPCPYYPPPANGVLTCDTWLEGRICNIYCHEGFHFANKRNVDRTHFCKQVQSVDGKFEGVWYSFRQGRMMKLPWPDCSRKEELTSINVTNGLEFGVDSCSEESLKKFRQKFLALDVFKLPLFCPKDSKLCIEENVNISCSPASPRERRSVQSSKNYKIRLEAPKQFLTSSVFEVNTNPANTMPLTVSTASNKNARFRRARRKDTEEST